MDYFILKFSTRLALRLSESNMRNKQGGKGHWTENYNWFPKFIIETFGTFIKF